LIVTVDLLTLIKTITFVAWVCVLNLMLHFQLICLNSCDCSRLLATASIFGADGKQATREIIYEK